ncbi:acetyl-CoA synthase subunit gamma [bacterium]|nr:acetyl-CoA synthase subunit gamma [bacterium]
MNENQTKNPDNFFEIPLNVTTGDLAEEVPEIDWGQGYVKTAVGEFPRVPTSLSYTDVLGSWKARWGIGRMNYKIKPGLYAAGNPDSESHVFVTANYKMSFDRLRSELGNIDGWILVLDTKGINVWCAAGKGTFGTAELVFRAISVRLKEVISHKKIILPQLGAPNVSAHLVKEQTGLTVVYGPVIAKDIPAFLEARLKATEEMRQVNFKLKDRLLVIPVEIVLSAKWGLLICAIFFLLSGFDHGSYSIENMVETGSISALFIAGGFFIGTVLTPFLLPWIPVKSFALKGAVLAIDSLIIASIFVLPQIQFQDHWMSIIAWMLIVPAISSFWAMNFTGASTFTSLSGVVKEMKVAIPLQICFITVGFSLWLTARFI